MGSPSASAKAAFTSAKWLNACGKLPSCRLLLRVVLLGEQPQVVAGRQDTRSKSRRASSFRPISLIDADEPERAREEDPFLAGEPVDVGLGLEAQQQPVLEELPLDRRDGADDPRIGRPARSR